MVDTTFKKLLSSFRLNNEQRREMIEELERVSGRPLGAQITGQQMSELLPRGIMRPLGGGFAGATALTTGNLLPILTFMAFASPRMVGETLRLLGFTSRQSDRFMELIGGLETLQRGVPPIVQTSGRGETPPQSQVPEQSMDAQQQRPPLESFQ